jgi:uncharacterized cupredoxin-like copper-binding protein
VTNRIRSYAVALALCAALPAVGCGSDDNSSSDTSAATTETTSTTDATAAPSGKGTTLKVAADPSGKLAFDKKTLRAPAGKVTIVMDNPSDVPHAVTIGSTYAVAGQTVTKGGVSKATAKLKAGKYEFYCPVDAHKDAGMEGALIVR